MTHVCLIWGNLNSKLTGGGGGRVRVRVRLKGDVDEFCNMKPFSAIRWETDFTMVLLYDTGYQEPAPNITVRYNS